MTTIKRKGDLLSKESKDNAIKEIIHYFSTERSEEIGVIAAEDMLHFFLQTCGEDIYRKGVQHTRVVLRQNLDNLETDLDLLSK